MVNKNYSLFFVIVSLYIFANARQDGEQSFHSQDSLQKNNEQTSNLFIVEGDIGAGKTTFLELLQQAIPDASFVFEPVKEWQNVEESGHNLLDAFYKNQDRWSLVFQLYAMKTRARAARDSMKNGKKIVVMERSWFADRYCFAKNCYLLGKMTDMEWSMYRGIWKWDMRDAPKPAGIIYLRVAPETCLERIKLRDRTEESAVPLDYLKMLHERHEDMLVRKNYLDYDELNEDDQLKDVPILIVNAGEDFKNDLGVRKRVTQQILDFFEKGRNNG